MRCCILKAVESIGDEGRAQGTKEPVEDIVFNDWLNCVCIEQTKTEQCCCFRLALGTSGFFPRVQENESDDHTSLLTSIAMISYDSPSVGYNQELMLPHSTLLQHIFSET